MAAETRVKNSASTSGVLAQVASRARVSTGTVSRVFNNSSLIPSETRSRVLSAARELGFRPRVGVRSKQIAIVTEPPHRTVMGGYVNTLTQHICYALSRVDAGITMITEDRIGNLADCWFDGVIGIAWEDRTIEILKKIHNIPMVWFSDNQSSWCHTVFTNCYENGKLAGQYLLGKGHRRIAVIHDPDYTGCGRKRLFPVHKLEHELSAFRDEIAHGAGLSVLFPAWALYEMKNDFPRFAQLANRVFGVEMDFHHPERTAREGILTMKRFFEEIGMPTHLAQLGIKPENYAQLAANTVRTVKGPVKSYSALDEQAIIEIYKLAE